MPCFIPNGFEEQWTENFKNTDGLNELLSMIKGWSPDDWSVEQSNNSSGSQMSLF